MNTIKMYIQKYNPRNEILEHLKQKPELEEDIEYYMERGIDPTPLLFPNLTLVERDRIDADLRRYGRSFESCYPKPAIEYYQAEMINRVTSSCNQPTLEAIEELAKTLTPTQLASLCNNMSYPATDGNPVMEKQLSILKSDYDADIKQLLLSNINQDFTFINKEDLMKQLYEEKSLNQMKTYYTANRLELIDYAVRNSFDVNRFQDRTFTEEQLLVITYIIIYHYFDLPNPETFINHQMNASELYSLVDRNIENHDYSSLECVDLYRPIKHRCKKMDIVW